MDSQLWWFSDSLTISLIFIIEIHWWLKQTTKWQKSMRILASSISALFFSEIEFIFKWDKTKIGQCCYESFAYYLLIKVGRHHCRILAVCICYLQFALRLDWWLRPWGMSQCQSDHTCGCHPEQWNHCCHRARRRKKSKSAVLERSHSVCFFSTACSVSCIQSEPNGQVITEKHSELIFLVLTILNWGQLIQPQENLMLKFRAF